MGTVVYVSGLKTLWWWFYVLSAITQCDVLKGTPDPARTNSKRNINEHFIEVPSPTVAVTNELVEFHCMITEELPLVWRINGTNLRLLTQDVRTNLTTMQTRRSSVLRILATEVTNNSNIECGVILQHSQVVEYSCPVPLLVQGRLSPPVNVTVTFIESEMAVNIHWKPPYVLQIEEVLSNIISSYRIQVVCCTCVCTTSMLFAMEIMTSTTNYQYDLVGNNISICSLPQINFTIAAINRLGVASESSDPVNTALSLKDLHSCHFNESTVLTSTSTESDAVFPNTTMLHTSSSTVIVFATVPTALLCVAVIISVVLVAAVVFHRIRKRIFTPRSEQQPTSTTEMSVFSNVNSRHGFESDYEVEMDHNECYVTNVRMKRNKAYERTIPLHSSSEKKQNLKPDHVGQTVIGPNTISYSDPNANHEYEYIDVPLPASDNTNSSALVVGSISLQVGLNTESTVTNLLKRSRDITNISVTRSLQCYSPADVRDEETQSELAGLGHDKLRHQGQTEYSPIQEEVTISSSENSKIVVPIKAYSKAAGEPAHQLFEDEIDCPSPIQVSELS